MLKFSACNHPKYAKTNDWYGVRQDGTIFSQKPKSLGARSQFVIAETPLHLRYAEKFSDWPKNSIGEKIPYLHCKSFEEAREAQFELMRRALAMFEVQSESGVFSSPGKSFVQYFTDWLKGG